MAKKLTAEAAFALLKAGLESGSIKLNGTRNAGTTEAAKSEGEADAAYLIALFNGIANDQPQNLKIPT